MGFRGLYTSLICDEPSSDKRVASCLYTEKQSRGRNLFAATCLVWNVDFFVFLRPVLFSFNFPVSTFVRQLDVSLLPDLLLCSRFVHLVIRSLNVITEPPAAGGFL